jgi:DNA repair ATPase RecN
MDIHQLLEMAKKLESKMKGKKEELERLQKLFERFHLLNRKYLDKETFEKAQGSVTSIAEAIANTLRFLDEEVARLRNKRMKLPFETLDLSEMQKVQARNELLLKEYLATLEE